MSGAVIDICELSKHLRKKKGAGRNSLYWAGITLLARDIPHPHAFPNLPMLTLLAWSLGYIAEGSYSPGRVCSWAPSGSHLRRTPSENPFVLL